MLIMQVYIRVKPECVERFKEITLENARNSLLEPGVARFDFLQQADDPTRFVLVECYRSADDPPKHKETAHYKKWAEAAADLFAEPRTRAFFSNVFPADPEW